MIWGTSNFHEHWYFTFNTLRPSDAYMHQQTNHHWFRKWNLAWLAANHYLNQCWNIVNLNPRTNFSEWKQISYIFIQENAFENAVWKMAVILYWPQCVDQFRSGDANIHQWTGSLLVQAMAGRLLDVKSIPNPLLIYVISWSLCNWLYYNMT